MIDFIINLWPLIVPVVYEIAARVIKTEKNLSLFDNAITLLTFVVERILPNYKQDGTTRKTTIK